VKPWHGVITATALPFRDDQSVDLDRYAEHVAWLAASGCHGVTPNGSLGEYQTLTEAERDAVVRTAVAAAPGGFSVIAGAGAYGAREARGWAERAGEAGAQAVLLLPPNSYRADDSAVVAHYAEVARAGLPVVAYNNPHDTKVDLRPDLLAELFHAGHIVAVKEFSGDVRRAYQIAELAPELDLLVGADDVLVELLIAGAKGWVAGYPNAFPRTCRQLYDSALSGALDEVMPLYRLLHPLLRWDSRTEFVQAIKLSMDLVGRYGGACRPPRQALAPDVRDAVRLATEKAVAAGCS
jgi:4-hydroxy-tetrahydrodipicolinate synthase